MRLNKDEQEKVPYGGAGIEDVNCKQTLDSLPSDFPLLIGVDYIMVESAVTSLCQIISLWFTTK